MVDALCLMVSGKMSRKIIQRVVLYSRRQAALLAVQPRCGILLQQDHPSQQLVVNAVFCVQVVTQHLLIFFSKDGISSFFLHPSGFCLIAAAHGFLHK